MTVRAFSIVVIRVTFVELTTSVCLARTLVFVAHRTLNVAQVDLLVGFLDERLQVAKCSRAHVEAHGVRLRVRDAKCSVRELFVPFAGNHASARVRIGALSTNLHARVGGVTAAVAAVAAIAATAADAAVAAKGDDGIIGLHIEGPHISVARRGTHNASHIRPMDDRTLNVVAGLRRHDIAVMITVAPEATTHDQIAALAQMGAVVSIGHTDATCEDTQAAISAGASCATHLFNAMSPMVGRAPGAVGAVINSHLWSGIICDGFHVDDRMITVSYTHLTLPTKA